MDMIELIRIMDKAVARHHDLAHAQPEHNDIAQAHLGAYFMILDKIARILKANSYDSEWLH